MCVEGRPHKTRCHDQRREARRYDYNVVILGRILCTLMPGAQFSKAHARRFRYGMERSTLSGSTLSEMVVAAAASSFRYVCCDEHTLIAAESTLERRDSFRTTCPAYFRQTLPHDSSQHANPAMACTHVFHDYMLCNEDARHIRWPRNHI